MVDRTTYPQLAIGRPHLGSDQMYRALIEQLSNGMTFMPCAAPALMYAVLHSNSARR